MTEKEKEVEELLVQVSKYMEFYSYQANREALKSMFEKFYDKANEAGSNSAIETLSEKPKEV